MSETHWENNLRAVHERGVQAWKAGRRSPETMFSPEDTAFLASIGCTTQELFDFVDDLLDWGEPDLATVIDVQGIRRDYFQQVMNGKFPATIASMADLPAKSASVDGISWLPRLIVKARLKLRGEMPRDLMYGCGGDRPFLRQIHMTLGGFLKLVWECGANDREIVEAVKRSAGRA